jgi:hypothetical protein
MKHQTRDSTATNVAEYPAIARLPVDRLWIITVELYAALQWLVDDLSDTDHRRKRTRLSSSVANARAVLADAAAGRLIEQSGEIIDKGDHVRAYVFADRQDCYVEGVVTDANVTTHRRPCYEIKVARKVWNGEQAKPTNSHAYPPQNGTVTPEGVTHYVIKI